jgi:hypothetical protein
MIIITDETEVLAIAERHTRTWPLFSADNHILSSKTMSNDNLYVGYSNAQPDGRDDYKLGTWKANIIGDVFYLLSIYIPENRRGEGHGDHLYRICENVAAEIGCREIRQTPSGWTPSGETRRSYLHRRGWRDCIDSQCEVFKRLQGPYDVGDCVHMTTQEDVDAFLKRTQGDSWRGSDERLESENLMHRIHFGWTWFGKSASGWMYASGQDAFVPGHMGWPNS